MKIMSLVFFSAEFWPSLIFGQKPSSNLRTVLCLETQSKLQLIESVKTKASVKIFSKVKSLPK